MAVLQEKNEREYTASIVIATANRPGLAIKLAESIRRIDNSSEIIIVEQGITTEIKAPDKITYIHLDEIHLSKARNAGIRQSTGDIIIFLDDDVEITSKTIVSHLESYHDKSVIGVAGRVIDDGITIPSSSEVQTGITNLLGTSFIQHFWSSKKQYVDFPYGCNMSFRRSILNKIHGFDEYIRIIFEEIELSARAKKYGKIVFNPDALVYHHKALAGGTRVDKKEKMKTLYRNYGYYLGKHIRFPLSIISLLIRTKTILLESSYALSDFYKGYLKGLYG